MRRGDGAVAQLGERLLCKQEVIGSIPFSSTNFRRQAIFIGRTSSELTGKPRGFPLIFDQTGKIRLFFNKTEEVKRTRQSIVACWVRLYRLVSLEFGEAGSANTRSALFSVMGSSD